MTTLPPFRPSIPHHASSNSHSSYSQPTAPPHPAQPQSANRPIPSPLPLEHKAVGASEPVPSLDPSNPDPRSAGSMTSSEGGPPTPSEFPRLAPDYPAGNKRRASTTALYHAPRVLLQPIPPFVQRKSFPPARQQDAPPTRSPSTGQNPPAYPSVFEKPSPSPDGMDLDENTSLEEGEVGRRGLGISVGSSTNGDRSAGSRKRRAGDGDHDFEPSPTSPKQIKRESSASPRPPSASNLSLDTLASAASSLASTSNTLSNLPHPPPSPIVLPLGTPSDPHKASQLANALNLRTQQLREIERRRASSGPSAASAASGMGGLSGALDKLSARAGGPAPTGSSSPPSQDGSEGSGLAKRRGNVAREKTKNLTILTSSSYGPNGVEVGLKSAPAKAPASRMAPGVTPSVLAGPMPSRGLATARPDFSSQPRRESTGGEGMRGRTTIVLPPAGTKSDRPRATVSGGANGPLPAPPLSASRREPYPSVTQPAQSQREPQRGEGSSYHPREREQHQQHRPAYSLNMPPQPHSSAHSHFPATAHSYLSNPQQLQQLQGAPRSARPYNSPPTRLSPPSAHPLSHSQQPGGSHEQPSPLPPMSSSQPHHQQQMQQQQQLPTPQTAAAPQASSKAAFLSLFSTFYDSLSDSRVLAHTLEDQIRRSSSLLHTLHESGKVFEDMLDKRVKEVVEDMSRDLVLNEGRIVRLEKIIGVGAGAAKTEEGRDGAMGDRLARLEGMVERLLSEKGGERRRSDDMDQ